jgi:hypothetical protein
VKAQCERCKEIVALEFRVAEGGIEVTCAGCKETYFVAATAPAPAPATGAVAVADSGTTCPKCGAKQPRSESCRRCGLVFAKWRGVESLADADELALEDARAAAELWSAVEKSWDDPAAHDAFITHCRKTGSFGYAAGRYRAAHQERPDDPIAERRLKQLRTLAEFVLSKPPKTGPEPTAPFRWAIWILAFTVIVLVGGMLVLTYGFGGTIK